jgi:hypothetical protein
MARIKTWVVVLIRLVELGLIESALTVEVNYVTKLVKECRSRTVAGVLDLLLHSNGNRFLRCGPVHATRIAHGMKDDSPYPLGFGAYLRVNNIEQ